jgi:hypothetical protein
VAGRPIDEESAFGVIASVDCEYERPPDLEAVSPNEETPAGTATTCIQATEGAHEGALRDDDVVPASHAAVFEVESPAVGEGGVRRALLYVPPEDGHEPNDMMAIVDTTKLQTIADVVDGVAQALDRQPPTPRA